MKFSLALLAAASAAPDDDRKYVNKNSFMNSNPPRWWNKHSAAKRHEWLANNVEKFFDTHFGPDAKAQTRLKNMFVDAVEDLAVYKAKCEADGRKRRDAEEQQGYTDGEAAEDGQDPLDEVQQDTRKVTGDIEADIVKLPLNIARWAKFEVFDLGGECKFLGKRALARTDRLRYYLNYAYCKQTSSDLSTCDWFYGKNNGVHPRVHEFPINKYPRPSRPQ